MNTFYSVLPFLYLYTITNFYSHSHHHYYYDYFCYYCFCHWYCHYYFFIFDAFYFVFLVFTILFYLCTYIEHFQILRKWHGGTMSKVDNKDTETILVALMGPLNTACLTYSSDDLLLRWHYYILPLTILSLIIKKEWLLFCKYFLI